MLKKLSVALCVASLFGAGVAMANDGTASGTIVFEGDVTHQAPTVVVKQGTSSGQDIAQNPKINIGVHTAAGMDKRTAFDKSRATQFQIVIQRPGVNAYNHVTWAQLKLSANVDNGIMLNELVSSDSETAADNVGVSIYKFEDQSYSDNGQPIFSGEGSVSATIESSFAYAENFDPAFYFAADFLQIDDNFPVGGGKYSSTLTVEVEYN